MDLGYKGYTLRLRREVTGERVVCAIFLGEEEVAIDDCPENGPGDPAHPHYDSCSLEDAISWIEEDIRCRKEEAEEEAQELRIREAKNNGMS